jgi:hypothetical protein
LKLETPRQKGKLIHYVPKFSGRPKTLGFNLLQKEERSMAFHALLRATNFSSMNQEGMDSIMDRLLKIGDDDKILNHPEEKPTTDPK